MQHELELTAAERAFGEEYRSIYAQFIKHGKIPKLKNTEFLNKNNFNTFGLDGISTEAVFEEQCNLFDKIDHWMLV